MVGVTLALAVLTIAGFIVPLSLLILAFALAAGDALETPTWRAVHELVIQVNTSRSAEKTLITA